MNQSPAVSKLLGIGLIGAVLTGVLGIATSAAAPGVNTSDGSFPKDIVQKLDTTITEAIQ